MGQMGPMGRMTEALAVRLEPNLTFANFPEGKSRITIKITITITIKITITITIKITIRIGKEGCCCQRMVLP
jgi:hypothetical protein